MFVCVCCVSLLHCLAYLILFVFYRAVFSAVFSLTVLSGLLFLLIDFFLVLLSMANKDITRSQAVARIADRTAKNCRGHVT